MLINSQEKNIMYEKMLSVTFSIKTSFIHLMFSQRNPFVCKLLFNNNIYPNLLYMPFLNEKLLSGNIRLTKSVSYPFLFYIFNNFFMDSYIFQQLINF